MLYLLNNLDRGLEEDLIEDWGLAVVWDPAVSSEFWNSLLNIYYY